MTKLEFENSSAILCARMVSLDKESRVIASLEAQELLDNLPSHLRNSPHCAQEIKAIHTLISSVKAETT